MIIVKGRNQAIAGKVRLRYSEKYTGNWATLSAIGWETPEDWGGGVELVEE